MHIFKLQPGKRGMAILQFAIFSSEPRVCLSADGSRTMCILSRKEKNRDTGDLPRFTISRPWMLLERSTRVRSTRIRYGVGRGEPEENGDSKTGGSCRRGQGRRTGEVNKGPAKSLLRPRVSLQAGVNLKRVGAISLASSLFLELSLSLSLDPLSLSLALSVSLDKKGRKQKKKDASCSSAACRTRTLLYLSLLLTCRQLRSQHRLMTFLESLA